MRAREADAEAEAAVETKNRKTHNTTRGHEAIFPLKNYIHM